MWSHSDLSESNQPPQDHFSKRHFIIIPHATFSSDMDSAPLITSDESISEFIAYTKRSVRPAHLTTICLSINK